MTFLVNAQINSLTISLGGGKLFENTNIPNNLPQQLNVRSWPSGHIHPFYNFRLNFNTLKQEFSIGFNNSSAGIGFYWKAEGLNSGLVIKRKLYTSQDFTQVPLLILVKEFTVSKLAGKNNDLCMKLFLGASLNVIRGQAHKFSKAPTIYEKRGFGSDTIGYEIINTTASKFGMGLVGELYICRRSKIVANYYSRFFGKIGFHQGLSKLADTDIYLRLNSNEARFNSISRGSFINVTVGSYLYKRR